MKVVLLNGYETQNENVSSFYEGIIESLNSRGWEVESILLKDIVIAPCQGCFECWVKTPGVCKIDDDGRIMAKKLVCSDLVIHFTPITFGGYSYHLKKLIDRFIPIILPFFKKLNGEIHHKHRYEKYASIIAIGINDDKNNNQEATFKNLIIRNKLNMCAPIHEALIHEINTDQSEFWDRFNNIIKRVEVYNEQNK